MLKAASGLGTCFTQTTMCMLKNGDL